MNSVLRKMPLVLLGAFAFSASGLAAVQCPAIWQDTLIEELQGEDLYDASAAADLPTEARIAATELGRILNAPVTSRIMDFRANESGFVDYAPVVNFSFDRANLESWYFTSRIVGAAETESTTVTRLRRGLQVMDGKCTVLPTERPATVEYATAGGYENLAFCLSRRAQAIQATATETIFPYWASCRKARNDSTYSVKVFYIAKVTNGLGLR